MLKSGVLVRMHFDTGPDRGMWLALLAPDVAAELEAKA